VTITVTFAQTENFACFCPLSLHSSLTSALIKLIKCSAPEIWRIHLRYGQSQTSKCIRSSFLARVPKEIQGQTAN